MYMLQTQAQLKCFCLCFDGVTQNHMDAQSSLLWVFVVGVTQYT